MSKENDVLIIRKSKNPYNEFYKTLKVSPEIHERVKKLAEEVNKNINELSTRLVEFALERVHIEED